jgi:hypothetical protein
MDGQKWANPSYTRSLNMIRNEKVSRAEKIFLNCFYIERMG